MPRIHIVGAGAIGGVLAARLWQAGRDVCLVDNDPDHVRAIRTKGLNIHGAYEAVAHVPAIHIADLAQSLESVILAVRCGAVPSALDRILGHLTSRSRLVTLQNGLIAHAVASRMTHTGATVFPGSVAYAGHLLGPGEIRHGADGDIAIGPYARRGQEGGAELVSALEPFGPVAWIENIWGRIWSKTALAVLLAAAAIDGRPTHEVFASRGARRTLHRLVAETVATAGAEGIRLEPVKGVDLTAVTLDIPPDHPRVEQQFATLVQVSRAGLPHKTHSGVYHSLKVRRQATETSEIVAPIIERALRHGIEPLVLRNLLVTFKTVEADPERMSPELLESLAKEE